MERIVLVVDLIEVYSDESMFVLCLQGQACAVCPDRSRDHTDRVAWHKLSDIKTIELAVELVALSI